MAKMPQSTSCATARATNGSLRRRNTLSETQPVRGPEASKARGVAVA